MSRDTEREKLLAGMRAVLDDEVARSGNGLTYEQQNKLGVFFDLTVGDLRALLRSSDSEGISYAALGRQYGVHPRTITRAVDGTYWRWL